jgi:antitoxin component YwqK of YwqJK toxin-antitoxin module
MKPTCFILLLLTQGLAAFAQKTEKFYDYQWKVTDGPHARFYSIVERTDSGFHRLDFYVHDMTLQMESSGRYLHNMKEGLWLVYHPNGMMADSTVYVNGIPIGACMAWYSNGIPSDS